MSITGERINALWGQSVTMSKATRERIDALKAEASAQENGPLPVHETAVCPKCGWAGVTMRGEECDCHQCDYRWRWPLVAVDIGMH